MATSKADKQKEKAKEMLGITDDRAKEIFQEQPDRKQQKKKELEKKQKGGQTTQQAQEAEESEENEGDEVEAYCPKCGDGFESMDAMENHKSQAH